MILVNLINSYYMKLYKVIRISSSIKDINTCHLSDLSLDTNNCISQFNYVLIPDNLQLMVIRDIHDQIATSYSGY